MEIYYDDERVTLGDGSVDVEQGIHGVQKVGGSRGCVRDPRLQPLAKALMDLPPLWKAPRQMAQVDKDSKWCFECGDVRPKSYFTADKRNHDGLDSRCKACEAARQRKGYEAKTQRPVRAYARHEKVAV